MLLILKKQRPEASPPAFALARRILLIRPGGAWRAE
jgi:hypothetical protein